jgi:phage replication O-like protein O
MTRALIPNSTQIPDVILDRWMAELSGAEFKVLLYIARRTYGFGKESDNISLTQIAQGITRRDGSILDRGTGVSRPTIVRALKALEERGIVVRQTNLSETGREFEENTYRINLAWQPPEEGPPDPENGSPSGANMGKAEGDGYKMQPPPSTDNGGVVSKLSHPVAKLNQGWSENATTVVSKLYPLMKFICKARMPKSKLRSALALDMSGSLGIPQSIGKRKLVE